MFPFGKKNPVGIDIGSDSIKAIKLKGISKNEIVSISRKRLFCESHEDPAFDARSKVALNELGRERDFSQSPCISTITDHSISFSNVILPPMPKHELIEAVKFEAKKELTYPISEAVIDYIIKDKPSVNSPTYTLTAIAVKKEAIYNHIELLKDAGFKPSAVEIGTIPLVAAFDHNHTWDPAKKTALLDIGASKSNLLIVKDRALRFFREIPMHGSLFTAHFQGVYDLPYADADEKKLNMLGREDGIKKDITDVKGHERLHALYEQMALELQRSFDYYQAKYREGAVSEIILSGGGALLEYIDSYLNEILDIPVTIDNPFKKLYFADRQDEEECSKIAPIFTTAVGLALRKV